MAVGNAPTTSALVVDRIEVVLGGRPVISNVSFSLGRGEFAGVIGANGAGKTTLLRTILGLERASQGSVRIHDATGSTGRPRVGYVPQKVALDPSLPLRARDLVALGLDGHRLGLPLPSPARDRLVTEMLEAVDAQDFADERVGILSGGQQQRILIAHALIRRPVLLVMDEPLASLDVHSAASVAALLAHLAKTQDVAILLSAHDMNPLVGVMDRIVYLANGHAAEGPVEEVLRGDVLSELYGHHVDVIRVHDRIVVVVAPGDPSATDHATLLSGGRETD